MNTTDWKDVTIVLANGEARSAKAHYAGDGWCDIIVESDGLTARMWVLADGSANPPMNPCRLAEPFPLTPLPARTLPVAPAERTAATMLRAWQAWQPDVTDPDPVCHMLKMFGVNAANAGLVYAETDDLTPAGRDLLARVDAAPMPLPPVPLLSDEAIKSPIAALLWFADEGHYEGTYRKGAGFAEACGMSIARKALGLPVDRPDNTLMPLSEALAGRARAETAERTPDIDIAEIVAAVVDCEWAAMWRETRDPQELLLLAEDYDGDDEDHDMKHRVAALRQLAAIATRLAGTTPIDAPPRKEST